MLRIDSFEFVATAATLVVAMRVLPRKLAAAAYALVSLAIYVVLLPNWQSLGIALAFVYWPWVFVAFVPRKPAWSIALLFGIQTALLLWARKYFSLVPALESLPLVSHAIVIVGVSYVILRQVELVSWIDANPDTPVPWVDYTAFTIGVFTLLAGPILRYEAFREGFLFESARERPGSLARAANRIVNGYIKVAVLGPLAFELSSLDTLQAMEHSSAGVLLFFYLYPLYVYLNFSGYCDVVIGFGRFARFEIPENFDRPYLATNIQNYWQRWHITFSHWIRNHLFFPLVRATRSSRLAGLRALGMPLAVVATFLLVGLWHGTDPGFAVFGLLHGIGVLVVAAYSKLLDRMLTPAARATYDRSRPLRALRIATCYHYLCFTMIFFERPFSHVGALLW